MVHLQLFYAIPITLVLFAHNSSALYEDQVGKFDWKRSFIGKVKHAQIENKKIILATHENVLASLNPKDGQLSWRQLLEDPDEYKIDLLHIDKEIYTISSSIDNWVLRSWDITSGSVLTEKNFIITERTSLPEYSVSKGMLYHVIPVVGSHLKVTSYYLPSGDSTGPTNKISAPWITDVSDCLLTTPYYVCISSKDYTGQIYFRDIVSKNGIVQSRSIHDLIGEGLGRVQIKKFGGAVPGFLIVSNNSVKLILIKKDNLIFKQMDIMPNAVGVQEEDRLVLFQLEASNNQDKLIRTVCKDYLTEDNIFSVDIDYPIGVGTPNIIAVSARGSATDLLLSTTDDAVLFFRLPEGKIQWIREEALSAIVATEFVELPVSELDASIENEFKTSSSNILSMLTHRLTSQAKQLSNFILGGQLMSNNGLVRDEFGLHKLIVVATRAGKLFALDTLSGSVAWSYRLPNVKPIEMLGEGKMILFMQRSARYLPLPAQCLLLAEDVISGNTVLFRFDPITGYSQKGIERLNYKIAQAMLLPCEDEENTKPVLVMSSTNQVYIYPSSAEALVKKHITQSYIYLVDLKSSSLRGFNFHHTNTEFVLTPTWDVILKGSKIVALSTRHPNERVHSQGRVLPDRSVYYKYVNPNLLSVATLSEDPIHKTVLSVYLIDGVTGLVLHATSHKRAKGPVHLVHSENWLVYSFFNERFRRTEIVSAELYEGHILSNSSVFSSHAVSLLPHVQTQSYILPAMPAKLAVTLTEKGITNKFLLLGLSNGAVVEIPWLFFQPRFEDIPCGPEESCMPYMPEVPLLTEAVINYNQSIGRIRGIEVAPARLESTSHILVHGLDIFYTRVAPSKTFDVLKEDFDYMVIVLVLSGLIVASYVTKYLAAKKSLKQLWK